VEEADSRITLLEQALERLESRLRRVEGQVRDRALLTSNKRGKTKRIRLNEDATGIEVE
jgi:hypothetical protein